MAGYALAGTVDIDLARDPLGKNAGGQNVFLRDIWPTGQEIQAHLSSATDPALFRSSYENISQSNAEWNAIPVSGGALYEWDEANTYIQEPPFFVDMSASPQPITSIVNARVLVKVGDSVTTDHISPAGSIPANGPAGRYLQSLGVPSRDFNSFGSRRGNDRVMTRGTFANIRLWGGPNLSDQNGAQLRWSLRG